MVGGSGGATRMEGGSVALVDHTPPSLTPHRCRRLALVSLLELGPRRSYAFALFRRPPRTASQSQSQPASRTSLRQNRRTAARFQGTWAEGQRQVLHPHSHTTTKDQDDAERKRTFTLPRRASSWLGYQSDGEDLVDALRLRRHRQQRLMSRPHTSQCSALVVTCSR